MKSNIADPYSFSGRALFALVAAVGLLAPCFAADAPQPDAKRLEIVRKAALSGDPRAQTLLGTYYIEGKLLPGDTKEAIVWIRKAAEQGFPKAEYLLGLMTVQREGFCWFVKSAEQGEPAGEANLGFAYVNGIGVARDSTQAMNWARKAADKGSAGGQR